MERDCQHGLYKAGMGSIKGCSDFAEKYGGKNRAWRFWIGREDSGKETDCPDFEASRAYGFVLRSLELHILSFIMGIQYPNLID
ncbi:hypothetical protein Tco_0891314 [Tanacetum coccineum]|uniref:Uncharacterized protein n=1 Tax=Tanacetum coccineum TaxID=301880 RepID=A0ABQ5C5I0_9ASTR